MNRNKLYAARYFAIIAALLLAATASTLSQTSAGHVTLTGRVSCAKCGPWEPLHKGYTRWT
jgi:hypothetical protein